MLKDRPLNYRWLFDNIYFLESQRRGWSGGRDGNWCLNIGNDALLWIVCNFANELKLLFIEKVKQRVVQMPSALLLDIHQVFLWRLDILLDSSSGALGIESEWVEIGANGQPENAILVVLIWVNLSFYHLSDRLEILFDFRNFLLEVSKEMLCLFYSLFGRKFKIRFVIITTSCLVLSSHLPSQDFTCLLFSICNLDDFGLDRLSMVMIAVVSSLARWFLVVGLPVAVQLILISFWVSPGSHSLILLRLLAFLHFYKLLL